MPPPATAVNKNNNKQKTGKAVVVVVVVASCTKTKNATNAIFGSENKKKLYNSAARGTLAAAIRQTPSHCPTRRRRRTFHTRQTAAGDPTESVGLDSRRCGFLETT